MCSPRGVAVYYRAELRFAVRITLRSICDPWLGCAFGASARLYAGNVIITFLQLVTTRSLLVPD